MKTQVKNRITFIFYVFLATITFAIVYNGPLRELFKGHNIDLIESFRRIDELTEPIIWPSIAICKIPFIKDAEKYKQILSNKRKFGNEAEFEQMKNQAFFTYANDTFLALTFGESIEAARENFGEFSIKGPYVSTRFVDFDFLGSCGILNLQAMRSYLIEKGEYKQDDIDNHFLLIVWIKVMIEMKN